MHSLARVSLALVIAAAASAAQAAASAESVEKLMQVMQVQRQLDAVYAQTLPAMQNAMKQSMAQQANGAEAQRMFDTVMPRVNAVIREELSWSKLKPGFASVYAETFTQQEVDGLITFYQGPVGQALVAKTPQLAKASMMMMQERMGPVMQRVMNIAKEEAEKARAASGPKR